MNSLEQEEIGHLVLLERNRPAAVLGRAGGRVGARAGGQ
jgi:hypothetical protein